MTPLTPRPLWMTPHTPSPLSLTPPTPSVTALDDPTHSVTALDDTTHSVTALDGTTAAPAFVVAIKEHVVFPTGGHADSISCPRHRRQIEDHDRLLTAAAPDVGDDGV